MLKIRLWATLDELAEALPALRDAFDVIKASKPERDREGDFHRVYVEAELKPLTEPRPSISQERLSEIRSLLKRRKADAARWKADRSSMGPVVEPLVKAVEDLLREVEGG